MKIEVTTDYLIHSFKTDESGYINHSFQWTERVTNEIPVFCSSSRKIEETEHWASDQTLFETLYKLIFDFCKAESNSFVGVDHSPRLRTLKKSRYRRHNWSCRAALIDDNDITIEELYIEGVREVKKANSKWEYHHIAVHNPNRLAFPIHQAQWKVHWDFYL